MRRCIKLSGKFERGVGHGLLFEKCNELVGKRLWNDKKQRRGGGILLLWCLNFVEEETKTELAAVTCSGVVINIRIRFMQLEKVTLGCRKSTRGFKQN